MASSDGQSVLRKGRCMCGAVEFEFLTEGASVTACHCGQCRAWSGHVWASVSAPVDGLKLTKGEERVGWFRSSGHARRGFCKECGSALFWHGDRMEEYKHRIAVAAGALSETQGLALAEHIFVADKGAYYEIADGLPQMEAE